MRKRRAAFACVAFGCGAVGLALATTGPAATGCTTHQCDQSTYQYFGGHMVDENTYVTNDLDSDWLTYNGNTTIQIFFPAEAVGRTPKVPLFEVGLGATPNGGSSFESGDNYTLGTGQLATLNFLSTVPAVDDAGQPVPINIDGGSYGGGLWVTNSSCASYFLRAEVDFVPRATEASTSTPPDGSGSIDAGGDATPGAATDSATADAPTDAGVADAGVDAD